MKIYFKKSLVEDFESIEKATWTQAGKHLETRTDKKGHLIHKWISNDKNKPNPKRKGSQELLDFLYSSNSIKKGK